ncbi:MAG TPA: hypothetical protein VD908_10065 [Cytophagales bacterium]|nr:hypothetical protein [Cytophagales bacterium]
MIFGAAGFERLLVIDSVNEEVPAILRTLTQQTVKKIALILLTVITLSTAYGQNDKHGNPVFNSELISEEKLDDFELTSSYYTIENNISNKGSSVYVSDKPTLSDYLKFARELPSNFFIAHQGQNVMVMIMLMQKVEGSNTTLSYNIVVFGVRSVARDGGTRHSLAPHL